MGKSRAPHHQEQRPSQSFFWQGLLIFLPLLVLAAAGIWSLRGQREAIEQKARQDATAAAKVIATGAQQAIEQQLRAAHPPVPLEANGDPLPFPFLYQRNPSPPADLVPYQRYLDALGDPTELAAILTEHPNAQSASGVPLKVIILYQQFLAAEAAGEGASAGCAEIRAELLKAAMLTHPSVLSGPILAEVDPASLPAWQRTERIREVLRQHIDTLRVTRRSQWVLGPDETVWRLELLPDPVRPEGLLVQTLPREEFQPDRGTADIEGTDQWLQFAVDYAGQRLRPNAGLLLPPPFASASAGEVTVTALLLAPGRLYAQQRRQFIWFLGIIAASALTALIGLWVTRRAFLKQQALNQLKSNFISSVSHELRAPIASIGLMAERLRAGRVEDDGKRHEYFGFIEQESRRLAKLVENVLDFSRIEYGRKAYDFQATDITQLSTDTIELMQPHARERGLTLRSEFQPLDREPSLDPTEIQQALLNLIDNALKYSPEGETITVGLEGGAAGRFLLWVEDHGAGIPPEEQAKIFQRFYRIGSELERETQGVGIGLAIVRHTAEAHGGSVGVTSQPGAGSRFTLDLPFEPPLAQAKA